MGSHSLLQGIFPTQGSNPGFPHCRQTLCHLSHWDKSLLNFISFGQPVFPALLSKCFLDNSVCRESACNSGDPALIPGWGRSTGEGIGYPLQYFWASLVTQLVKNSPAMWETWIRPLGWEDPLKKGKATHSSILAWRTPWTV